MGRPASPCPERAPGLCVPGDRRSMRGAVAVRNMRYLAERRGERLCRSGFGGGYRRPLRRVVTRTSSENTSATYLARFVNARFLASSALTFVPGRALLPSPSRGIREGGRAVTCSCL